jgi:hypothetical protein
MNGKHLSSFTHEMHGDGRETGQMEKLHIFIRKRSIRVYLHDSRALTTTVYKSHPL